MTTQTPLGLWWTKTMGIAEATRSASLIRRASPLMASVVVETSFGGGSVAKETFVRDLVVDGESTWVMWPPMSTTPVASRAPTIPADHAPALVGVAAIQLRRAESASALIGKVCAPSSEG